MSCSTSSSDLESKSTEHVVLVVGDSGAGKSTLIAGACQLTDDVIPTGISSQTVTKRQTPYQEKRTGYTFIDTVGLNKPGFTLGAYLREFFNKRICWIFVLSNPRWESQLNDFLQQLNLEHATNVLVVFSYLLPSPAPPTEEFRGTPPMSVFQFQKEFAKDGHRLFKDKFQVLLPPPPRPPPTPPPQAEAPVARPLSLTSPIQMSQPPRNHVQQMETRPVTRAEFLNLTEDQLNHPHSRGYLVMYKFMQEFFPTIIMRRPTKKYNFSSFLTSLSQDDVKRDCSKGDRLLKLFFECYYGENGLNRLDIAGQYMGNIHLSEIVDRHLLLALHIRKIYPTVANGDQLSDQTKGDYMEALFASVCNSKSKNRRYFMELFNLINGGN